MPNFQNKSIISCKYGFKLKKDIVQIAMGLWYKKTMLECGMLESCWTRTIRRSVDLPVPLRTKNNRHKVRVTKKVGDRTIFNYKIVVMIKNH